MVSLPVFVLFLATITGIYAGDRCAASDLILENRCYFFNNQKLSYYAAKKYCESTGRSLAIFDDMLEINFVTSTAVSKFGVNYGFFWIGLQRDTTHTPFYWIDGTPLQFTHWSPGFPFANHLFASQLLSNGQWKSNEPTDLLSSVCSTNTGYDVDTATTTGQYHGGAGSECVDTDLFLDSRCYSFNPTLLNRYNAVHYCASISKSLAVFDNIAQGNFVTSTAATKFHSTYGTFWIGLYRNPSNNDLHWGDNSGVGYSNWNNGYPYASLTYVSQEMSNGQWKSSSENELLPVVCSGFV